MKRTLFVTSNRLGDAVLTTGALQYLHELEPDIPITVVCGHLSAEIFANMAGVERVVAISKQKYSGHWLTAARELGFKFWHRIVDYRGSPLSLFPARHRHVWRGGADDVHKAIANARMLGLETPLPPRLDPDMDDPDLLGPLEGAARILALAPTANFFKKQWHHDNYVALAQALTAEGAPLAGAKVVVLGAPGEEAQALPVVAGLPEDQVVDFVGKTTPLQAAKLIRRSDLFVGNDSGLMHTSVAVGRPTVGLFGIGKPAVYGPWGDKSLCLIGDPAGVPITRQVGTDDAGREVTTESLPPAKVIADVQAFMEQLPEFKVR